ncbi:MAG: porin [Acetobacter papayae]
MASRKKTLVATVMAASVASLPYTLARHAMADDYSDLLDVLRAKGSLTQHEYSTLLSKHVRHTAAEQDAAPRAARPSAAHARAGQQAASHAAAHGVSNGYEPGIRFEGAPEVASSSRAEDAATRAEASARSAQQALDAMNQGNFVRVAKYVPGKGLTFKTGPIDINLSGFINGFYTFNSPGGGPAIAGGVSTGSSGFDSSGVRNGLLPAGLILKLSTQQQGWDIDAVLGMYPGMNNAKNGAFNANTGGSPVGLGTPGIDFRQIYVTFGNSHVGTFKVGRDLGLFGGDAILNDATLLSVGATGSNSAPGNTSLGRIGVGYVYADWIPQITYTTPKIAGVQASVGVFQPLDEFQYAGSNADSTSYSASSTQHSSPMIQGKVTYEATFGEVKAKIWASFLIQHQQNLQYLDNGTSTPTGTHHAAMVEAGDIGAKVSYKGFEGVAYYYRGSGLGTTGLFFDGVAANGSKRDSEGYYVQAAYNVTERLKLVGSYGVSNLYLASGEAQMVDPAYLVRRNQSVIGAAYYHLTDWLNLVGEYAHTSSDSHNGSSESDDTASAGVILLF